MQSSLGLTKQLVKLCGTELAKDTDLQSCVVIQMFNARYLNQNKIQAL